MNYVMTLSGPKRRVTLLGPVTDTITAHPVVALLGLLGGLYLGLRHKRSK